VWQRAYEGLDHPTRLDIFERPRLAEAMIEASSLRHKSPQKVGAAPRQPRRPPTPG